MVNLFGTFFQNVYEINDVKHLNSQCNYGNKNSLLNLCDLLVPLVTISYVISQLNVNKGPGPDNISAKFKKKCLFSV